MAGTGSGMAVVGRGLGIASVPAAGMLELTKRADIHLRESKRWPQTQAYINAAIAEQAEGRIAGHGRIFGTAAPGTWAACLWTVVGGKGEVVGGKFAVLADG